MKRSTLSNILILIAIIATVAYFLVSVDFGRKGEPDAGQPIAIEKPDIPDSSYSYLISRYPAVIDGNQSEAIVAPVSGFFEFDADAFNGEINEGGRIGSFKSALDARKQEYEFLSAEYEELKLRIERMSELQRASQVNRMGQKVAEMREQVKVLEAIENDPDLEGTLAFAGGSTLKFGAEGGVETARMELSLAEAEYELLTSEDSDRSSEKKAFEVESKLAELKLLIESLEPQMPFQGKFTPAYPSDVLGRKIAVSAGDVIGLANDTSSIFLKVVSSDPELAILDGNELTVSLRVGGKLVNGPFVEKGLVESKGRPVPSYRFILPADEETMKALIGTTVTCEINRVSDQPLIEIAKLQVVRHLAENGMQYESDWRAIVEKAYPDYEFYAETQSAIILKVSGQGS